MSKPENHFPRALAAALADSHHKSIDPADLWDQKVASGMSPDAATAFVERIHGPPPTAMKSSTGALSGAARTAFQGASLGFGDEIEGAARGVGAALTPGGQGFGEAYREGTDAARADVEGFRKANPVVAAGLQVAGGFVTGGVGAGRALGATAARTALQQALAKPIVQGAVTGGLSGAGSAEGGLPERLAGALKGAALGGAVGGALQGVGAIRGAHGRAASKVTGALERSGVSDLQGAATQARPGETLMEIGGESVRKLARAAESKPSAGAEQIKAALLERSTQAPTRIKEALQKETGLTFENGVTTAKGLAKAKSQNARDLYEAAYSAEPIRDPAVIEALQLPAFRAAFQRARRIAQAEGRDLTLPTPDDGVTVEALDLVKRGLDDVIGSRMRSGKMGKAEARALRNRLRDVIGAADKEVPTYGAARAQYAGDAASEAAFLAGRKDFLRLDPREVAENLSAMEPSEAEFFRRGALDAVRRKLEASADGRDLTKVLTGNSEMRDRVRLLFADEESFDRFMETTLRERGMADTKQFVLGGSPTARIQEEQADLAGSGWKISDILHPIRTSERIIDAGVERARSGTESTVDQLAPLLTASDDKLKELVRVLEEFGRKERTRKALTAGAARAAGVPLGLSAGRDAR